MEGTQTLNIPASVEEAKNRLLSIKEGVSSMVVGREEEVFGILLAILGRQHVVMVGPPGTAKSYIALAITSMVEAQTYKYLMTRYTTYDEIFGPIDVAELARTGTLRRNWSPIIEAEFVFLDEIFNANSAILNSLLSLMQERVVYDPLTGTAREAKLWTMIGATNRAPEEEELAAVYDRFAVKLFPQPIGGNAEKLAAALEKKWMGGATKPEVKITMEDIKMLHDHITSMLRSEEVLKLYNVYVVPLVQVIASKMYVSDRTIIEKLPLLFAASMFLHGEVNETAAASAAYRIVNYLARTVDELNEVKKAVDETLGELADLRSKLQQAYALLENLEFNKALELFREVALIDINKFGNKPWLMNMAKSMVEEAQQQVLRIQSELSKFKIRR
jgi:MoxR-like ATPase